MALELRVAPETIFCTLPALAEVEKSFPLSSSSVVSEVYFSKKEVPKEDISVCFS